MRRYPIPSDMTAGVPGEEAEERRRKGFRKEGEDGGTAYTDDQRHGNGLADAVDVPPSPELGGEDGAAASYSKEEEHEKEEDLIAQGDRPDLHLPELTDHDGVHEIENGHHERLQRDGKCKFYETW